VLRPPQQDAILPWARSVIGMRFPSMRWLGPDSRPSDTFAEMRGGAALSTDGLQLSLGAGVTTATLTVTPVDDMLSETTESLTLLIAAGAGYAVGSPASSSGSITDNDSSVVSVTATDSAGSERGPDPIVFSVARTGGLAGTIVIALAWSGTAKLGTDYTVGVTGGTLSANRSTLTLGPGVAGATLTITPIDDTTAESTETATVTLGAGAGYTLGSPTSATGSIADDDTPPAVSVATSDASGAEQGSDAIVFTISRASSFKQVVVNLTWGGTATFGSDYAVSVSGGGTLSANGQQLTLGIGVFSATITVTPVDDNAFEPAETVTVTVATGTGYTVGAPSSATGSIADNDTSVVSVATTNGAGSEQGQSPIVLSISRTGNLANMIAVALAWSGTATFGSDYTVTATGAILSANGLQLSFAPGATGAILTVTPIDDSIVESTETVILTLGSGTGYNVGSPSSASGLIADNDAVPAVSIAATDASGAEQGSDSIVLTITRTNSFKQIVVNLTRTGTAAFGTDYAVAVSGGTLSANGLQLTLAAGVDSATLTLTPVDDAVVEATETVTVTIGVGTGYSVATPSSATGSIVDNDNAVVTVNATDVSGSEQGPDPIVFAVSRTGSVASTIAIALTWSGTAAYGTDYTVAATGGTLSANGLQLTLAAGATGATLTITPVDDATAESTEAVTLTLAAGGGYTVGTPASASGSIADNDTSLVTVTATDPNGAELGADPIVFVVSRTFGLGMSVTISLAWSGTATYKVAATGGTVAANGSTLTLAAGVASATLTLTPVDDTVVESTETVTLTLVAKTGYSVGSPSSATGSIVDDDVPPQLSIADVTVTETNANQTVTISVTLSAPSNVAVTVTVTTVAGTALAGEDFTSSTRTLKFNPGVTQLNVSVTIVGDKVAEPMETLTVVLSNATNATIADDTGVVSVLDDDVALTASAATPDSSAVEPPTPDVRDAAATSARAVSLDAQRSSVRAIFAPRDGFTGSRDTTPGLAPSPVFMRVQGGLKRPVTRRGSARRSACKSLLFTTRWAL